MATAGGLRQTVSVSGQTETILKEVKDVKSLVEATRKIQRSGDAATVDLIRLMTSEEYGPAACAVLEKIGRSIVARLIGVMASADTVRAAKAAEILGGIDDPRKFGPLFMALRNEQLASSAVEAIARSKWPEALWTPPRTEEVISLLRNESSYLALEAAGLLVRIDQPLAAAYLVDEVNDPVSPLQEVSTDVSKLLRNMAHADGLKLADLLMASRSESISGGAVNSIALENRLRLDSNLPAHEGPAALFKLDGMSGYGTREAVSALTQRIAAVGAYEAIPLLHARSDRLLGQGESPTAEALAMAMLSPSRIRSTVIEMIAGTGRRSPLELLLQVQEPDAPAVLAGQLKIPKDPEDWFGVAQTLGKILVNKPAAEIKGLLEAAHVQEERIAAVIGASQEVGASQKGHPSRFPLGVPQNYFMLSVGPDPNAEVDPEQVWLLQDRLITSNAVLDAFAKNNQVAVRLLDSATPINERAWGLLRVNTAETTGTLRSLMDHPSLYQPLIIRELGLRRDRKSVSGLTKLLASESAVLSAAAARALAEISAPEALPSLRSELSRKEHFAKRDILEAILRMEGDSAAPDLYKASANWGSVARHYLYYRLAASGSEGEHIVLNEFAKAIPNGDEAIFAMKALMASHRLSAAQGLARILLQNHDRFKGEGNGTSIRVNLVPVLAEKFQVPEMVDLIADLAASSEFEAWIAEGLKRGPSEIGDKIVVAALGKGAGPSRFEDYLQKRPIPGLGQQIKATYIAHERKSWDLRTLIQTGSAEGLQVVRDLLAESGQDKDVRARVYRDVIDALYKTPGQEGWDLLPDLYDRLPETDRLDSINRIPHSKAHPAVVQYLTALLGQQPVETKDFRSRPVTVDLASAASVALERLDAGSAIGQLLAHWDRPGIRVGSVMLVGRHGDAHAAGKLIEMIRGRDFAAWRRLDIALAEIARRDSKVLLEMSSDTDIEVRRKAAAAAGLISGAEADRVLLSLARDTNPSVRSEAVAFMARGPASSFGAAIVNALKDEDLLVREEAAVASGALGIAEAIPALRIELLASERGRPGVISPPEASLPLQAAAAYALQAIGGHAAETALIEALVQSKAPHVILQLGAMKSAAAVPVLGKLVGGSDLQKRQAAIQALGWIATDAAATTVWHSYVGSQKYVDRFGKTASTQKTRTAPQPPDSSKQIEQVTKVLKRPSVHFGAEKLRFSTDSAVTADEGKKALRAFDFSYRRAPDADYITWSSFAGRNDAFQESWNLFVSRSEDGGISWEPPEKLLNRQGRFSHYQLIMDSRGQKHLVTAYGRTLFSGTWDARGKYSERKIEAGTRSSEIMTFNILQRHDGTYLLFAAVGTPAPNDSLRDMSQLVMLSSRDLETWSAPAVIAPVEEGMGFFTVDAIPAIEIADGSIIVGVGKKLFHSTNFPGQWETVWEGGKDMAGWLDAVTCLLAGKDGRVFLGYRASRFGYGDLYLIWSDDLKVWSNSLFTDIHDSMGDATGPAYGPQFLLQDAAGALTVVYYLSSETYKDAGIEPETVVRSLLNIEALRRDSDVDGLTDAIEERLLTDPTNADTDGDGIGDAIDLNPLSPPGIVGDKDRIRQAALERLNYWHEQKPDMSVPAQLMIIVTDGDQRQEFKGYPGIVLNLSAKEREEFWQRFGRLGIYTQEIIIVDYQEGGTNAVVHTFTGHEAFLMTLTRLGNVWVVTKVQSTFRVY
ncbi:MAG: hypothetical protein LAP85_22925 [Acidobacteriia bacterium]|nr:hypothetical protein [Terriglobia bacterium]